ncbi:uncharacterized protein B0P05DRAFT_541011 [Gilbertella persicaria]|uniref:uncharacterized protein n=1 Tax=Gilbertella persicaria TaxID=101096 RepID=UPI0022208EA9|nr:uncharacterized protein B0P05DRAFT_541011 [Gilbertella persicaria]KAI8079537.1 hypothetical protein B0P05DRAFT_541011 [Gilbertella persicaria]
MRLTCAIPAAVMLLSSFVAALDNAEFNSASIQSMERPNVAFYKKNQGDGRYLEEDFKDDEGQGIIIIDRVTETITIKEIATVTEKEMVTVTEQEMITVTEQEMITVTELDTVTEKETITIAGPDTITETVSVTVTVPSSPIPRCFKADTRTPVQQRGTPFSYSDCAAVCQRRNLPIAGLQYRVRQNSNNLYACFCYPSGGTLPSTPSDRCHLFQESSNPNYLYYYGETVNEIYLFPATQGNVLSGINNPSAP